MNRAKAYAIKVEMPESLFDAFDKTNEIISIVCKDNNPDFIGVHQRPDGSYLLFRTSGAARNWSHKLKINGVMAWNITQPCYYNPDLVGGRAEVVPPTIKRDFENYNKLKDATARASIYEREKAELKRQLGNAMAQLKESAASLTARKEQVAELITFNEKIISEKNDKIARLERRVAELEKENEKLKHSEKCRKDN